VFVDYNNAGKMKRLPLLPGATLTSTSPGGGVKEEPNNDEGVWVVGNARQEGRFSATVQLLTATAVNSGACAYASNYPPVGEYIDAKQIKFTGTPPYNLVIVSEGSGTRTCSINDNYFKLNDGEILQSFTDKTSAPGMMKCFVLDNPIGIPNSRCGAGVVTISTASTSTNTVIDWYDTATGGTVLSGGSATGTFTPSIVSSTSYYAQARDVTTGCVSVARTAVVATVNTVPAITLSGGAASQAVYQGVAITTIVYSASNSTITRTSGSFPTGMSGTPSGASFTIRGTPSATGTYNYTLTAVHSSSGCTSTTAGAIRVNPAPPTYAVSAQTWSIGGLTWSDRIVATPSNCTKPTTLTGSGSPAEYMVFSNRYYYTWRCAVNNANLFCPTAYGWRLPTSSDWQTLIPNTTASWLTANWGLGGAVNTNYVSGGDAGVLYWASTASTTDRAYRIQWKPDSIDFKTTGAQVAFQVRCVK
jgi:hypothetical protein